MKLKSSPADLVTQTDQLVEKVLISAIGVRYPEHRFLSRPPAAQLTFGGKARDCQLLSVAVV